MTVGSMDYRGWTSSGAKQNSHLRVAVDLSPSVHLPVDCARGVDNQSKTRFRCQPVGIGDGSYGLPRSLKHRQGGKNDIVSCRISASVRTCGTDHSVVSRQVCWLVGQAKQVSIHRQPDIAQQA